MAVRPIDANALHAEISKWPESVMYKDWVQSAIANSPTLTPPNEPLTCEGCMYIDEYFGPCAHCMRARGYVDRYRRLPKGEAK